jgi:hypothetical protein
MREIRMSWVKVALVVLFVLFLAGPAQLVGAQEAEPQLELGLSRDFGYGSGLQIQGRFSYRVSGPDDLVRVQFLLDDEVIGEDTEPPFRLRFQTGDYELGWHTLSAVGYTAGGSELRSETIQRNFVSGQTSLYIVIAAVVLVVAFRAVSHFLTRDRSGGQQRKGYGMYGGAVCPKCGRPFSRHWWSPGLLVGRLDRCPHCGKWSLVGRATPQMLASAEAFAQELDEEAQAEAEIHEEDEQEKLRRRIEESRYDS